VPQLQRPDGVEIHWEARGEGPPVVICHASFSLPSAFEPLIAELEHDHRVVTYDPRGSGQSTRVGPYEIATDATDMEALLEELGEPAVLIGFGEGLHRNVQLGHARPDLVLAAVSSGVAPLGPQARYGQLAGGLASSPSVLSALLQLFESDYRSGLRTVVEGGNSQLDDAQVQARIDAVMAYSPRESTVGRIKSWIGYDSRDAARAMGDRLWILVFQGNLWFPEELVDVLREEVPDAHIEDIPDGPLSRPDTTAAVVRRITHC
jgi:pimeloyl-ACP methyl ester carboxylesterase